MAAASEPMRGPRPPAAGPAPRSAGARRALGRPLRGVLRRAGYDLVRTGPTAAAPTVPPDCDAFTASVIERVGPYTLTSAERIMGLVEAVRYVVRADVPGDVVECGVWRGGSMMAVALTLVDLGVTDRDLYLFDTFASTPEPGDEDVDISGVRAADMMDDLRTAEAFRYLPLVEVERLLQATGYPSARLRFVPGLVEDTLPAAAPRHVAICRLDTDWYSSTAHELAHLWPRVATRGVLLVDDYGQFAGARKAVDEYFAGRSEHVLLNRIDYTARLVVKPA